MRIETKRLILRTPRISDWKDLVEGIGNINVSKTLAAVPYPYKKKDAISWIKKEIERSKKKNKKDFVLVIELKSEKKVIGGTGFHHIDYFSGKATTGSWIAEPYWRKGYIMECKIPLIDYAFDKLKLQKLETSAFFENIASNEMSKKLGYTLEGRKRRTIKCKATGKYHDENIYGLLKEDWKKVRKKLIKEQREK